jgi:uncharacterized protein (TIGR03437 family)
MRFPIFAIALALVSVLRAQTGIPVPALAALDQAMTSYLAATKTAGGSLAVSQGGRLVYARGFGQADTALKIPVQPDSLFRVASVSKPITAMTALRLIQDGRLTLDAPIVPLLGAAVLPAAAIADARWNQITVRHLLQHSGGWDAEATFDPLTSYAVIESLGLKLPLRQPLTIDDVVRFMARQPLQFAPGTKYAYSNFGMLLLGRVLERVTGVAYEKLVRDTTLEPMGIQRMALGGALSSQRRLGEVEYYDPAVLPAVYPGIGDTVPAPDGGFYFEVIQGAGAWIASAIDLVRFANGVTGRTGTALLLPETIRLITTRPSYAMPGAPFYGLGWQIESNGLTADWSHDGFIPGTFAFLYRTDLAGGVSFAFTFNGVPSSEEALGALLEGIRTTLFGLRQWPGGDQFETYLPATTPRVSGIVNAASHNAQVSPGTLVSLHGLNLGPATPADTRLDSLGRVTTSLEGVEVLFDGIAAPLLYVARNQINAVAPMALRGRAQVRIEVQRNGLRSSAFMAPVRDTEPGFFTLSGNGRALALALNADGSLNGETSAAPRASIVTLWGTGLENFTTALRDGEVPRGANPLSTPPRVTLGGQPVELQYAGAAPGFVAGVLQLNLRIPAGVPPGRALVEVAGENGSSRQGVWLWIR